MTTFFIILAVIVGVFVLICVLAGIAGLLERILHPHGYDVSPQQVQKELQEILDGKNPYALDDFISCGSLKDPQLESIRMRVAKLDEEFPPESKGEYCGPKGIEVIRQYIQELGNRTKDLTSK